MFTSQPTVSEHIQNLEARLNCKLFDRLGRSILPTEEAEILYPRAMAILEDLQRLEDDISAAGTIVSGELLIGASTIPGTYILPGIAAAYKADFPGISFEIRINDSAKITEAVENNELLVGVVGAKSAGSKLHYQPFTDDELIIASANLDSIPSSISFEELRELPIIIREIGSGTRKNIESVLARHQMSTNDLNICATLGSSAAVKEAIKANLGISAISRYAVQDELDSGKIKKIHIDGLTMKRDFYLVTLPKRSLPQQYKELVKRISAF